MSRRVRLSEDVAAWPALFPTRLACSISLRPSGLVAALCAWAINLRPSSLRAVRTTFLIAFRPEGLSANLTAQPAGEGMGDLP